MNSRSHPVSQTSLFITSSLVVFIVTMEFFLLLGEEVRLPSPNTTSGQSSILAASLPGPPFLPSSVLQALWLNYLLRSGATIAPVFASSSPVSHGPQHSSVSWYNLFLYSCVANSRSHLFPTLHPTVHRISTVFTIQNRWEILLCQVTNYNKGKIIFYPSGQLNTW